MQKNKKKKGRTEHISYFYVTTWKSHILKMQAVGKHCSFNKAMIECHFFLLLFLYMFAALAT